MKPKNAIYLCTEYSIFIKAINRVFQNAFNGSIRKFKHKHWLTLSLKLMNLQVSFPPNVCLKPGMFLLHCFHHKIRCRLCSNRRFCFDIGHNWNQKYCLWIQSKWIHQKRRVKREKRTWTKCGTTMDTFLAMGGMWRVDWVLSRMSLYNHCPNTSSPRLYDCKLSST